MISLNIIKIQLKIIKNNLILVNLTITIKQLLVLIVLKIRWVEWKIKMKLLLYQKKIKYLIEIVNFFKIFERTVNLNQKYF